MIIWLDAMLSGWEIVLRRPSENSSLPAIENRQTLTVRWSHQHGLPAGKWRPNERQSNPTCGVVHDSYTHVKCYSPSCQRLEHLHSLAKELRHRICSRQRSPNGVECAASSFAHLSTPITKNNMHVSQRVANRFCYSHLPWPLQALAQPTLYQHA